jgi:hypothetical protein
LRKPSRCGSPTRLWEGSSGSDPPWLYELGALSVSPVRTVRSVRDGKCAFSGAEPGRSFLLLIVPASLGRQGREPSYSDAAAAKGFRACPRFPRGRLRTLAPRPRASTSHRAAGLFLLPVAVRAHQGDAAGAGAVVAGEARLRARATEARARLGAALRWRDALPDGVRLRDWQGVGAVALALGVRAIQALG